MNREDILNNCIETDHIATNTPLIFQKHTWTKQGSKYTVYLLNKLASSKQGYLKLKNGELKFTGKKKSSKHSIPLLNLLKNISSFIQRKNAISRMKTPTYCINFHISMWCRKRYVISYISWVYHYRKSYQPHQTLSQIIIMILFLVMGPSILRKIPLVTKSTCDIISQK